MGDSRDCWQSFCCFLPVIFIDYIICTLLCVITYNSLSAFSRPPPTPACFASPIPYQEIKWNKGDGPFLPAVLQMAIIHCQIFEQVPSRATHFVGPHPQEELSATNHKAASLSSFKQPLKIYICWCPPRADKGKALRQWFSSLFPVLT